MAGGSTVQVEVELRELAGLLSDEVLAVSALPRVRRRLHALADRIHAQESPYLTVTAAARRYGIDRKDFRRMIDEGLVESVWICGRERVDVRRVEM